MGLLERVTGVTSGVGAEPGGETGADASAILGAV